VEFLGFEAAVAKADVISIHVPLTDSTRNLLNEAAFAGMKDGVVIVNTARGGVIDENALLAALRSGKVSRAGLDVVATEDFAGSQLLRESHVTLTPHIGWCSEDSVLELQRKVGENVVACLTTGKPNYPVNRW
jgi:lactate dehydrogenase-like 2-hydroxyacid dehydrogenase